jgi:hypothetical protein
MTLEQLKKCATDDHAVTVSNIPPPDPVNVERMVNLLLRFDHQTYKRLRAMYGPFLWKLHLDSFYVWLLKLLRHPSTRES